MNSEIPPSGVSEPNPSQLTDERDGQFQKSGSFLGKIVGKFFSKSHLSSAASEVRRAWENVSSFCKNLHRRTVKALCYIPKHIGEILPVYFAKVGIGSVAGFVIGALTPVGPMLGTVSGLMITTGWQLCIECHTDRDETALARF